MSHKATGQPDVLGSLGTWFTVRGSQFAGRGQNIGNTSGSEHR
jgi:hypothetical protein